MSKRYTHRGVEFTIFFVLRGLLDGERGISALTIDDRRLADGWYYMWDYEDDPICVPYSSREDAIDAAREFIDVHEEEDAA